jgi:hypothetical protein
MGVREVWSTEIDDIAAAHLHPVDIGGAILSLDQPEPPEAWRWGGPDWRDAMHTEIVDRVVGAELAARDPRALSQRWSDVLGIERTPGADGAWHIALDGSQLAFAPLSSGEQEGLRAIELRSGDPERALEVARRLGLIVEAGLNGSGSAIVIAGTRFRLR